MICWLLEMPTFLLHNYIIYSNLRRTRNIQRQHEINQRLFVCVCLYDRKWIHDRYTDISCKVIERVLSFDDRLEKGQQIMLKIKASCLLIVLFCCTLYFKLQQTFGSCY